MSDVFISYAHEDVPIARLVASRLREQGWAVFWDREVPIGETWDEVLERELSKAHCIVVLWSPASVTSRWVRLEATEGVENGTIVPAIVQKTQPPLRFKGIQSADLVDWRGERSHAGISRLIDAVRKIMTRATKLEPEDRSGAEARWMAIDRSHRTPFEAHIDAECDLETLKSLEIRSSKKWEGEFVLLHEEFDPDEKTYLFWDLERKRLLKFYKTPGGVRLFGPEKPDRQDEKKIEERLAKLSRMGSKSRKGAPPVDAPRKTVKERLLEERRVLLEYLLRQDSLDAAYDEDCSEEKVRLEEIEKTLRAIEESGGKG